MALKALSPLDLYRASTQVTPSAEMDALVLAAARAAPLPTRWRREMFIAAAAASIVIAAFTLRIASTPTAHFTSSGNGLDEGLARAWLMDLDLQQPTGPGSQEGLP